MKEYIFSGVIQSYCCSNVAENGKAEVRLVMSTERIKRIAAGKKKEPCFICGAWLVAVRTGSGGLAGVKCPHGHESWPLIDGKFPHENHLRELMDSVAAGNKVPCAVCGEPLIAVRTESSTLAVAKCPREHEIYTEREMVESVAAGKKVPCRSCGRPLIFAHVGGGGNLTGVKCPHGHESYPMVYGTE